MDLSVRRRICGEEEEDGEDEVVEDAEGDVVAIWYLYVDGIAAWYWARTAKRMAVGPAGR